MNHLHSAMTQAELNTLILHIVFNINNKHEVNDIQ